MPGVLKGSGVQDDEGCVVSMLDIYIYMCQGLNSHYFHIIGDGHQPNSRGLYTHCKDSVIKGGRSPIPNIATFDHGTYILY